MLAPTLAPMLAPTGLFETHLNVSDLARAIAFYRDVVGLEPAHLVPDRAAAIFWIGERGRAMLGLWGGSSSPNAVRQPLDFHGAPTEEPTVLGWMPAAAVYFGNPDGHSLEVLAMLEAPPRPDLGNLPWRAWQQATVPQAAPGLAIGDRSGPPVPAGVMDRFAAQPKSYCDR